MQATHIIKADDCPKGKPVMQSDPRNPFLSTDKVAFIVGEEVREIRRYNNPKTRSDITVLFRRPNGQLAAGDVRFLEPIVHKVELICERQNIHETRLKCKLGQKYIPDYTIIIIRGSTAFPNIVNHFNIGNPRPIHIKVCKDKGRWKVI